jgi:hypothetical protein
MVRKVVGSKEGLLFSMSYLSFAGRSYRLEEDNVFSPSFPVGINREYGPGTVAVSEGRWGLSKTRVRAVISTLTWLDQ